MFLKKISLSFVCSMPENKRNKINGSRYSWNKPFGNPYRIESGSRIQILNVKCSFNKLYVIENPTALEASIKKRLFSFINRFNFNIAPPP